MIEIAICLAIIGIALVAIVGVLPIGMHTQQDNREETIINQDATVLMEDIRNGDKGASDLTNYIYAITNTWTEYDPTLKIVGGGTNGYTVPQAGQAGAASVASGYWSSVGGLATIPASGTNIIGLLSTPLFQGTNGSPNPPNTSDFYSNHVVAYVYSISGPAYEKPPQSGDSLVRQSSFAYRLICETVPVPLNPPATAPSTASAEANGMQNNLYELRLLFRWPQQPDGSLGSHGASYRTMIAGQLQPDAFQPALFFFQPQSFTNELASGGSPP